MRFGTSLFAALVLVGVLANSAWAQTPANLGPYSVYSPGLSYRQDSSYTGPYSGRGPGLTYQQDTSSIGPYSGRFSSAYSPAPTLTDTYSSLRTAALTAQTGPGRVLGDIDTRPDAVRAPAAGAGPGASHRRYVRLSVAGNAVQAIVIP
jgi:hypothetical protein